MYPTSTAHKVISVIVALMSGLYMLPWMISVLRESGNTTSTFWVNLALGWTIIGWVIALVMSLRTIPQPYTPTIIQGQIVSE